MPELRDEFYKRAIDFFSQTQKTSWGKNELVAQLKELYINYLEETRLRARLENEHGSTNKV